MINNEGVVGGRPIVARAGVTVAPGGRVRTVYGRPPLTVRRLRPERPDTAALCLVGSAAGPLAGDRLRLEVVVEPQARATLTATGASLAQGRDGVGDPASMTTAVTVGSGGRLDATPPPLVACAGSRTDTAVSIDLAAGASLRWRELVVLGRGGETGGAVRLAWDVHRDGVPLLCQQVDLADAELLAWEGLVRRRRVLATELVVGGFAGQLTDAVIRSELAVAQPLADDAVLLTVLGDDAATVDRELAELRQSVVMEAS
jgi:urease accessory protein